MTGNLVLKNRYEDAIKRALAELGVPQPGYAAPITNAIEILSRAINRCPYCGKGTEHENVTDQAEPSSEAETAHTTFIVDLKNLINYYNKEKGSNTPDFLLAQYLSSCLRTFDRAVTNREDWYGRSAGQATVATKESMVGDYERMAPEVLKKLYDLGKSENE